MARLVNPSGKGCTYFSHGDHASHLGCMSNYPPEALPRHRAFKRCRAVAQAQAQAQVQAQDH